MKDSYRTLEARARGLYKEKGSKFLAFAYPVQSKEEINSILEALRKEYHDARHHCYAWRLGSEGEQYRANDDGEPSGTAGRPILAQLQTRELSNLLVVVVRYFGGTLLGVGGLIRAYRSATINALENARTIDRRLETEFALQFPYIRMNDVMRLLKDLDLNLKEQRYDNECMIRFGVWLRHRETVIDRLSKIESCSYNEINKEQANLTPHH